MKKIILLAFVGMFCLLSLSSCSSLFYDDSVYTRVATITTVEGDSTTKTTNVYYRNPVYNYPVYGYYYYYPRYYYVPPRPHYRPHHHHLRW